MPQNDQLKQSFLETLLGVLLDAQDCGWTRAGLDDVPADAICDLCDERTPLGRLLHANRGVGMTIQDAGELLLVPLLSDAEPYFLCPACFRGLHRDSSALLHKLNLRSR